MTLSYRFTVDPDAYAKGHGIEIKDKGNGNESLSAIFGNAANRANARRKGTQTNG